MLDITSVSAPSTGSIGMVSPQPRQTGFREDEGKGKDKLSTAGKLVLF